MPFDSSKPFEVIDEPKSGFDPSQPFEPVPSSKAPPITDYSDSLGLRPEPLLNPYGPRSTTSQQRPQFSTVSELGSAMKAASLEPAFPIPRLPDVEKVPPSSLERGMINAFTAGNAPKNIDVPVQSVREAANLAIGVPEFLESGAGITAAGAGVIAPIATAAAFTADMAHSLWQQVPDLWNKWDKLTNPQRAKALVDIVGTGGLMALLGHGGIKGVKAKVEAKAREAEKAPPLVTTPEQQPGEAPPITTETKGPNALESQTKPVLSPMRTRSEPSVQQVPTQESGGQAGARGGQEAKPQEVTTSPKTSEDFVNLKPEELAQWQSKNKYGANEDKSAGVTAQKVTSDWTIEKDLPKLMDEIDRSDDAVKEVMPAVEAAMQAGKVEEAMKALQGLQPLQNKRGRLLEFARDIPGVKDQLKGIEHDEATTLAKLRSLSEAPPETKPKAAQVNLGTWPQSEWSAASLAKQSPSERSQKAKYLGAKDKTGALQIGPKTLSALAEKRITEIKAEVARKSETGTKEPVSETKTPIPATEVADSATKTPSEAPVTPATKENAPRGTSGELYINPIGPLARATAADLSKLSEALGITPAAKKAARKIEQYRQAFPVIMQSRPVRHIMDQTRDAADTMANNLGRQLGNRIRTGATDLEQMAASAMIAGKFDPAEFPSLIAKAQRGNHAEAEKALNYALANWSAVEPIARRGEQVFASQLADENAHGINTVSHEGYLPGLYDEDLWMGKGRPFIIGGQRGGVGTGFKKGKTYDSPFDAIADGYVPKSLKLGDLVENRVKRGQRLINNVEWSDSLRGILDPSDGKPVVTSVEKHARPGGLPGYETVPMGYARRSIIPGMDVAVHEEYVNLFDALTGNSHVQEFEVGGVPVGNIALETEGALKHGLLVFDTFHASRILQKELFLTKRIGYKKGFTLLEYTDADLGLAVAPGDVTPEMAAWARVNRSTANLLQKAGLNVGRVQEAMYNAAIRNIPGIGTFNRWVFEKVTRGAMLESGLIEFERVKKANPMWTDNQVAVKVARDLNKYFGNLGRQGVFKSKTFQDLSRLAFLAPQWVESMARSELGGIKQLTIDPLTSRTLHVGTLGVGMAQGLAAYFVGTQILNMVTRGHPTWENPEKGRKLDAWIPDITGKSRGYFLSPFGVVAELTHDLIKYSSQEPDVLSAAARIAKNRSSPLFRAGKILVGGEDWDKTKIQGSWNRVKKAAFALVPTPIPLQSIVKGGPPGQTQRQITSSLGVKTDPAGSPRAETVQSGREWALNSPNAKIKANAERKAKMDFGESTYKPLRSALLRGDRDTIISEVKELVNREPTQEKRVKRFKEILTDVNPFSSNGIKPFATPSRSKEDEIAFAKSLDANGKAAYKEAVKDAVRDYRKLTEAMYGKPRNPEVPTGYEAFLK